MNNIELTTKKFKIIFELVEIYEDINKKYFKFDIYLHIYSNQGIVLNSRSTLSLEDLLILSGYFDKHIENLYKDSFYESEIFTTKDMFFYFQALPGYIQNSIEDYFELRFMININDWENRLFVGCEGKILVSNIFSFLKDIKDFILRNS